MLASTIFMAENDVGRISTTAANASRRTLTHRHCTPRRFKNVASSLRVSIDLSDADYIHYRRYFSFNASAAHTTLLFHLHSYAPLHFLAASSYLGAWSLYYDIYGCECRIY